MTNFTSAHSDTEAKAQARQAVLDFLPEKVEKIISLPAESFLFEAAVKIRYPKVKIYGYEREKKIMNKNMINQPLIPKTLLYDYIKQDVFQSSLEDIDFAWLDLCSNPTTQTQFDFIRLTNSAKPGLRIILTVSRKLRNIKEDKSHVTVDRLIKVINCFSRNGKVVRKYDYVNGRSPMTMLFIQF